MSETTDKQFPDEIDLGREVPDYGSPVAASEAPPEKKTRTVYPCLYINGGEALKKIPDQGCCMIRFKRVALTTRERDGDDQPDYEVSVELDVHAICLGDGDGAEDNDADHEDLADGLRKLVEAAAKK